MIKIFTLLIHLASFVFAADDFQSFDNMLSTFKESEIDGYSWRIRESHYIIYDKNLTKEKLLSTVWVMDPLVNQSCILVFYADDFFKIGTYQGGVSITGKYKIINSNLILYKYNIDDYINNYIKTNGNDVATNIKFDSDNVFYNHELNINGIKFFAIDSNKENAEIAVVFGVKVIVENSKKIINDNVYFRSKPNTKSKILNIGIYEIMNDIKSGTLRKGTIVETIAKTEYFDTYEGLNAPWYFIQIPVDEGSQFGWVFAGYLKKGQFELQ